MREYQVRAFGSGRSLPWHPVGAVGPQSAAHNFVSSVLQYATVVDECWHIHVDNPGGGRRRYEVRMVDRQPEHFVELEPE